MEMLYSKYSNPRNKYINRRHRVEILSETHNLTGLLRVILGQTQ